MQYSKRKVFIFYSNLLLILSTFVFFFSLLKSNNVNSMYNLLWIWPLTFCFFCILCYSGVASIRNQHMLGITLVVSLELLPRYVLYPLIIAVNDSGYSGIEHFPLSVKDIRLATIYSVIELVALSFFLWFVERRPGKKILSSTKDISSIKLGGNKTIYLIYVVFAFIIYIIVGRKYNVIQFLILSSGYSEVLSNVYVTLVKYIVSIALCILTLVIINHNKMKYFRTNKSLYVYLSIVIAMVYTCFIVGESRSTQIAIGLLMCLILINDYPKQRLSIIVGVGISVIIVVASITLFRTGSSLLGETSCAKLADKLQVYYGGPESIAQSIVILKGEVGIGNFIFDFIRSCFPFNLILKNTGYTTSQLYNLSLYNGLSTHGHVIFGLSFGYIFFGIVGIPLTMCLNVGLILLASSKFFYSKSYEMRYLSGYCLIRLVSATLVNTPSILGSVTQYIVTFGLLYFVSKIVHK